MKIKIGKIYIDYLPLSHKSKSKRFSYNGSQLEAILSYILWLINMPH